MVVFAFDRRAINPMSGIQSSNLVVPLSAGLIPDAAKVYCSAFRDYLSSRLGYPYMESMLEWFRRARNGIALVALNEEKRAVGFAVGAPVGYAQGMNRDQFWQSTFALARRPWLLLRSDVRTKIHGRLRVLLGAKTPASKEPELTGPTMSLVGIGVSSDAQGGGIGTALLDAFEQQAREAGMCSMRLSVYAKNTAARKLYERHGWQKGDVVPGNDEAFYYWKTLTPDVASERYDAPERYVDKVGVHGPGWVSWKNWPARRGANRGGLGHVTQMNHQGLDCSAAARGVGNRPCAVNTESPN